VRLPGGAAGVPLDALALDAVRTVRSQLGDAPAVTLASWEAGDAVVILLRYRTLRSRGARSVSLARQHHLALTTSIGTAVGGLSGGRLQLLGSSFSAHRCLSALAFGPPDEEQWCPLSAAPHPDPDGALPAAD
jgi:hypothetical protein